jgi:hypothetical protein
LEVKKAQESISERERQIMNSSKAGVPIHEAAKRFSTVPKAISEEMGAAMKRIEALSAAEPACIKSITYEKIFSAINSIIGQKKQMRTNVINFSENVGLTEKAE